MTISESTNEKIQSTEVYFYRGAIASDKLLSNDLVLTVVKKILSRNYQTGDLEKLNGRKIYSMKMNQKERLLFTTIRISNGIGLLILEHLDNHKYENSPFLQLPNSYLQRHRDKIRGKLEENKYTFIPADQNDLNLPEEQIPTDITPVPVEYYSSKFIRLNDTQENIVTRVKTPSIISGAPGSGKSLVAMSVITDQVSRKADYDKKMKILYICSEPNLAANMRRMWEEQPISEKEGSVSVSFLSYLDLLKNLTSDPSGKVSNDLVTGEKISEWLKGALQRLRKNPNTAPNVADFDQFPKEAIFEEFQLLSGYTDKEYLELGKKQCIFTEPDKRKTILALYADYTKWLSNNKLIDPIFLKIEDNIEDFYDLTLVDEAADFSTLAIKQLLRITRDNHALFFIDTHQDLNGIRSKREHLKKILCEHAKSCADVKLSTTHRSSQSIIELANRSLGVKLKVTGGVCDKEEYSCLYSDPELPNKVGQVRWEEDDLKFSYGALVEQFGEPQVAVIAQESFHKEIEDKLGKLLLLYTPQEVKGLEFSAILLYHPLQYEHFKKLDKKLKDVETIEPNEKQHRSKVPLSLENDWKAVLKLNELFTCITRAKDELVVFQQDSSKIKNLKRILINENSIGEKSKESKKKLPDREAWLKTAEQLRQAGDMKRFYEICKTKLELSEEEITNYFSIPANEKKSSHAHKGLNQTSSYRQKKMFNSRSSSEPIDSKKKTPSTSNDQPLQQKSNSNKHSKAPLLSRQDELDKDDTPIKKAVKLIKKGKIKQCHDVLNKNKENPKIKEALTEYFFDCIEKGNLKSLKLLLEHNVNTDELNVIGQTALERAILKGKEEIVELLIEKGADVNAKCKGNNTALMWALVWGNQNIVKLLIEKGADVNAINDTGTTALMVASELGNEEIVELLIEKGADVNAKENTGKTALTIALLAKKMDVAKILIEKIKSQNSD